MEIEKTETVHQLPRPGVSVKPATGEANVPTPEGDVRVEMKAGGSTHFLFNDTPASRDFLKKLVEKNDLKAEASAAQGESYNPTFWGRIKSVSTSNVTPAKLVIGGVVMFVAYQGAKWLGKRIAEYFGWNLFGNIVNEEEMYAGGNKDFDERKAPRRQAPRRPNEPTMPSAAA